MLQGKSIGDGDYEYLQAVFSAYFGFGRSTDGGNNDKDSAVEGGAIVPTSISNVAPVASSGKSEEQFSSIGKTRSSRVMISVVNGRKIFPMTDKKSTALNSSTANASSFVENFNADLEFENKMVVQMDNVIQKYTSAEGNMLMAGLSLIAVMKMDGAIPFKGEHYLVRVN